MCLIIASPTGKRVSKDILEDAIRQNSHGNGIAWHDTSDKVIRWRKGIDLAQAEETLEKDIKPDQPWVFHARIATVGDRIGELTHPFSIDATASTEQEGQSGAVLFHNGTFGNWKDYLLQAAARGGIPLPEPPWSDSRALAFCLHVYGKHLLSVLDNHSRFLVFDAKDVPSKRMLLWGDWADHEDFKFSNRSNCAFYPASSNWRNPRNDFQQNRGSGSENPPVAEAGASAADSAESTEDSQQSSSTGSPTSVSSQSSSPVNRQSTAPTTGTKSKAYTPKAGHNPWRSFTAAGVYIRGPNEPAPV